MNFICYGHSCFKVYINKRQLLFDPFISPNPLAKHINLQDITADYIFLSHGHLDHIADIEFLAKQTEATIICNWEIAEWLGKKGITKTHPINTGGKFKFDFGTVKATIAHHSSSLPDGSYGGNPIGFVVSTDTESFYYSGDTALTLDMQWIAGYTKLDYAVLPIGDNFTMGVEDAVLAAGLIQCNKIIGVHYNTFGFITIDTEKAKEKFESAGIQLLLPKIGDTINL